MSYNKFELKTEFYTTPFNLEVKIPEIYQSNMSVIEVIDIYGRGKITEQIFLLIPKPWPDHILGSFKFIVLQNLVEEDVTHLALLGVKLKIETTDWLVDAIFGAIRSGSHVARKER